MIDLRVSLWNPLPNLGVYVPWQMPGPGEAIVLEAAPGSVTGPLLQTVRTVYRNSPAGTQAEKRKKYDWYRR